MLEAIAGLVLGPVGGAITGLLGLGLQTWATAAKQAKDLELARLQGEQTLRLMELEQRHQLQLANISAESAERLAALDAESRADAQRGSDLQASYKHDSAAYLDKGAQKQSRVARWLMALVDFLRGVIRPAATVYSFVLLTLLVAWVQQLYAQHHLVAGADDMRRVGYDVINTVLYITNTCTVWWFGARANNRR